MPVALNRLGIVVALRHALAPGICDPSGFLLGDCTTQRNLDSRGRAKARAIGDTLRHAGLGRAPVYSSRWCRCLEAAELLALGPVIPLPALDPFFGEPALRGTRDAALRAFLAVEGAAGPPSSSPTRSTFRPSPAVAPAPARESCCAGCPTAAWRN